MAELHCPHCNGINFRKAGFLASGKQRYICKDCKKGFSSFIQIAKQPNKPCIYCHGNNTVKSGRTKNNIQIWLCKDCNRKFNENNLPVEHIEQKCPYCGGEITVKGWSNNHTVRRYVCKSCRKSFSGNLNNIKVRDFMPCPYCHSNNVKKGGRLTSGLKRYVCNDCGKGYNEGTKIVEQPCLPESCPKCGEHIIARSGKDNNGKQRYRCKSCGYKFIENPVGRVAERHEVQCPKCNNMEAVKCGKTNGKQYWKCTKCGHKYLLDGVYKHRTQEQKQQIVDLYKAGVTQLQISEFLNISIKTIYRILKEQDALNTDTKTPKGSKRDLIVKAILNGHNMQMIAKKTGYNTKMLRDMMRYEYKKEKLSPQQKDLIIKFGVNCAVPIDYLAPYVPCSQRLCKQILHKYEITQRKKPVLTEQEKAFDRLELDKFIRK